MSMRSSFIYGYGFNSDWDDGKLIDFIKNHKEAFCKTDGEKYCAAIYFTVRKNNKTMIYWDCERKGWYVFSKV